MIIPANGNAIAVPIIAPLKENDTILLRSFSGHHFAMNANNDGYVTLSKTPIKIRNIINVQTCEVDPSPFKFHVVASGTRSVKIAVHNTPIPNTNSQIFEAIQHRS